MNQEKYIGLDVHAATLSLGFELPSPVLNS